MVDSLMVQDSTNQLEERRHPTLYFSDGDFVISATSRGKTFIQLYRVDKVFLARHSPVFKDMLFLGDGDSHNEQYDGAPKVHFLDDAEDVADLIGAMYNAATLPLARYCHDTPRKVQGIMRLAVKYDIEAIRTIILRHIQSEWPQTVTEWEQLQKQRTSDPKLYMPEGDPIIIPPERRPDPALAVRFAVEFNCPRIVSVAFFELAVEFNVRSKTIAWESLQAPDVLMILAGTHALVKHWKTLAKQIKKAGQDLCTKPQQDRGDFPETSCEKCVVNYALKVLWDLDVMMCYPLTWIHRSDLFYDREIREHETYPCIGCDNTFEGIVDIAKKSAETMWEKLPDFFEFSRIK